MRATTSPSTSTASTRGARPAPAGRTPGGLRFEQAAAILRAVARVADVAGIDLCEFVPRLDLNGLTALTITRLLTNLIGVTAHKEAAARDGR